MKATLVAPVALIGLFLTAACSSSEGGTDRSDAGTDSQETGTDDPEPVWKPTSERLELSSFGFFEGSQGYDITRAQLSSEQLEMLEGLREIPTPEGPLGADFVSYTVRVTDRSGEVVEYRAAQQNVRDSDEGPAEGKHTLDYETLAPFLTTFDCASAKEYGPYAGDASSDDHWAGAATLSSDPGCIHGVFVSYETSHSYRRWQVDEPGTYRLAVVRCFQQMRLRLFDPKGEKELASSEAMTSPECPTLVHHFDAPGLYLIDLEKSPDPAAAHDSAGDARMRVSQE
jgi:hypothetical protein